MARIPGIVVKDEDAILKSVWFLKIEKFNWIK